MASEQNEFDAIVVGSGMSGGWAAKELTEPIKRAVFKAGFAVLAIASTSGNKC